MSGNRVGVFQGKLIHYDCDTSKQGPPNVDVPLEHQTQECLIAYIQSLEKQAERDEKRRESEYNLMQAIIDEVYLNKKCNWCRLEQLEEATMRLGQFRLDALTPATQEKGKGAK